ncbi:MAG: hypothetical protein ACLS63_12880 [Flavonifractor plautii]
MTFSVPPPPAQRRLCGQLVEAAIEELGLKDLTIAATSLGRRTTHCRLH